MTYLVVGGIGDVGTLPQAPHGNLTELGGRCVGVQPFPGIKHLQSGARIQSACSREAFRRSKVVCDIAIKNVSKKYTMENLKQKVHVDNNPLPGIKRPQPGTRKDLQHVHKVAHKSLM